MEEFKDIKEMDWRNDIDKSCTGLLIGAPGAGKTFLEQFLTYAFKHIYPVGTATCGTEDSQGAFAPIFGDLFTQSEFVEEDQIRHYKRQKQCIKENTYPLAIEFLDDCSDDPKIYKLRVMRASFKNGRQHWKRLHIVGLQYLIDMPAEIRNLASFIAIFPQTSPQELEKLYKNFGGAFGSLNVFKDAMKALDKHECLIILNLKQSHKIEDCVRWFKAPGWKWSDGKIHPYPEGWKFGCQEFQQWNAARYNPDYVHDVM